jgi:hypothetical protein
MAGRGQGAVTRSNGQQTAVPPFPTNAADNGLSVDPITGHIVLGSDLGNPVPGQLLSARMIDMNGHTFVFSDVAANPVLSLDPVSKRYVLGDFFFANGRTSVDVDDNGQVIILRSIGIMAQLDFPNQLYQLGDIGNFSTNTFFEVDAINSRFNFSNLLNTSRIKINGVTGFTGTVTPVVSITVNGGIVTNVT